MSAFTPFSYIPDFDYTTSAWDRYALKYASLLQPDTLYYLHKQVMYDFLERNILTQFTGQPIDVLDVNCGTGNDFPFWLQKTRTITGTDGSAGMLNKAAETYAPYINKGQLSLYKGLLQDMDSESLGNSKFDIIYSITGGFTYISDEEFTQSFNTLKCMLKPGGVMITAHLNTFCLSETIAFLRKGHFKRSLLRLKKNIPNINEATMHLRSAKDLNKLLGHTFKSIDYYPLISIAPPYQTDIILAPEKLKQLREKELKKTENQQGIPIADQVIAVCR